MSNSSEHIPERPDEWCQIRWTSDNEDTHPCVLPTNHQGDHACFCGATHADLAADREELFQLWLRHGSSFESDDSEGYELADALLAAGWRKETR